MEKGNQEVRKDDVQLALEYFGINKDRKVVTAEEVDEKYLAKAGSYASDGEDNNEMQQASNHHLDVLTKFIDQREYNNFMNEFYSNYRSEIKNNELSKRFIERSQKEKKVINSQETAERLFDKKFAYNFLKELQSSGYNKTMPYGCFYPKNTMPPMSANHSGISAVMLYSDNPKLPAMVIELGNKSGGIKIDGTLVSARDSGRVSENCTVFKMLSNPSQQEVRFVGSSNGSRGIIPKDLVGKQYSDDPNITKDVQGCVNRALANTVKSMPNEMKDFATRRATAMRQNSNENAYITRVDSGDDHSMPKQGWASTGRKSENLSQHSNQPDEGVSRGHKR